MTSPGFAGPAPPQRFNMARYCLGPSPARSPHQIGLRVVHDGTDSADADERWTFAQLQEAVCRIASGLLELGLAPGDRVLLRMGNTSDAALVFFGAIAVGLVAVPTSSMLTADEVGWLIDDARPGVVVAAPELAPAASLRRGIPLVGPEEIARWRTDLPPAPWRDSAAEDPAFLVYTSGTTGEPKGVLHAHRSAWGRRPMYAGWLGLRAGDVMLHAGALNWTYTLGVGLTDPWAVGATAVVYNGPRDPSVWGRLVARSGATIFAAVPGVYRQWLAGGRLDRAELATLRHGLTAGEALSPDLYAAWQRATGLPLYEALGMSEISTYVSAGPSVPTRPGSPGKPQAGRCVAILPADPADGDAPLAPGQTGLLAVHRSDPGLLLGYWERPEEDAATRRGDWFVGGDLAHIDADGYVLHHGRADDVMNPGGYRVSPQEVERVLAGAPGVADVGVTEVEVGPGVRVVGAFVVAGPAGCDPEKVREYAAAHLAAYKVPRVVRQVEGLPRTSNGKLLRRQLTS